MPSWLQVTFLSICLLVFKQAFAYVVTEEETELVAMVFDSMDRNLMLVLDHYARYVDALKLQTDTFDAPFSQILDTLEIFNDVLIPISTMDIPSSSTVELQICECLMAIDVITQTEVAARLNYNYDLLSKRYIDVKKHTDSFFEKAKGHLRIHANNILNALTVLSHVNKRHLLKVRRAPNPIVLRLNYIIALQNVKSKLLAICASDPIITESFIASTGFLGDHLSPMIAHYLTCPPYDFSYNFAELISELGHVQSEAIRLSDVIMTDASPAQRRVALDGAQKKLADLIITAGLALASHKDSYNKYLAFFRRKYEIFVSNQAKMAGLSLSFANYDDISTAPNSYATCDCTKNSQISTCSYFCYAMMVLLAIQAFFNGFPLLGYAFQQYFPLDFCTFESSVKTLEMNFTFQFELFESLDLVSSVWIDILYDYHKKLREYKGQPTADNLAGLRQLATDINFVVMSMVISKPNQLPLLYKLKRLSDINMWILEKMPTACSVETIRMPKNRREFLHKINLAMEQADALEFLFYTYDMQLMEAAKARKKCHLKPSSKYLYDEISGERRIESLESLEEQKQLVVSLKQDIAKLDLRVTLLSSFIDAMRITFEDETF